MYEDKQDWYFSLVRQDIAPLLPAHARQVLELGCGDGATLAWLKASGLATHTTGVELMPGVAEVARTRVDRVCEGDVGAVLPSLAEGAYDLVLCLDVLEHLVDPWSTLRRANRLLRPGGQLIVSLPNVRHHSVLLPLLLGDRWQYEDAGIMDRTHLRFFTRRGARQLVQQAGFQITDLRCTYAWGSHDRWKDWATLTLLRGLWAYQYLIAGRTLEPATAVRPARRTVPA